MNQRGIVRGPKNQAKQQRAKQFRKEMTVAETELWSRLRANRLEGVQFRRQQVIDGFIADFYCHSAGLVVEVDGGIHREQADYDRERDKIIELRGLKVIRFTNDAVISDIESVLSTIRCELC